MKNFIFLFFVVTVMVSSCKKDIGTDGCQDFPEASIGFGYKYKLMGAQYQTISFNPNNYSEFFGSRIGNNGYELYTYDLQTQAFHSVLQSDDYFGKFLWSRNNWILLNGKDWNIYKIKPNGDSLTKLTLTGNCLYPTWNYDGTQIIYYDNNINKSIIHNLQVNVQDTIHSDIPTPYGNWTLYPDLVVGLGLDNLYRYKISNGTQTTIPYTYVPNDMISYAIIDSNNFIFNYDIGVYTYNWQTSKSTLIMKNCDAITYTSPCFNPHNQKMYFSKMTQVLLDKSTIQVQSKIVQTDLDGSNEQQIIMPE